MHGEGASSTTGSQKHVKCSETVNLNMEPKLGLFSCEDCSESFETEIALDFHKISFVHCKKVSKERILTSDETNKTEEGKPFQCAVCSRIFTRRSNMTRHQNAHNRVKVPCPECNKSFTSQDILRNHIQNKHACKQSVSESKAVVCKGCREIFVNERVLKKHTKYCVHL
jgi:hypothetical protein